MNKLITDKHTEIMELELKHLASYLPYKLNCMAQGEGRQSFELQGISDVTWVDLHEIGRTVCEQYDIEDCFPILRPLSDINKKVHTGNTQMTYIQCVKLWYNTLEWCGLRHKLSMYIDDGRDYDLMEMPYNLSVFLFEHHFDVFGLIPQGLAIDINTL